MTYLELLQDLRWDDKRKQILKRDNWTCQYCGTSDTELQVHHMWYETNTLPWDYEDWALITLCKFCHEAEEFEKNFKYSSIEYLMTIGFLARDVSDLVRIFSQCLADETDMLKVRQYIERVKALVKNG